jgi:RES domain-containing protein
MIVFRLTKTMYAADISGEGARLVGGRWNAAGTPVLYTASSRALCLHELLVHLPGGQIPKNYSMVVLHIPDIIIRQINTQQLAKDWKAYPSDGSTIKIGQAILQENHFPVIKVPSAVIPEESNYLINPKHPLYKEVEVIDILPFSFDKRLFS